MEAERTKRMKPFYVMDVLERACCMEADGQDVIHLEIGEPDFDVPAPVTEAAERAVQDGRTHYTHSLGIIELREAIAAHYADRYGVEVSPERICVTNGSSPAILLGCGVLLEHGDEVVISDPGYACYPNFISFVGGVPAPVRVYEEDGFQYRADAIRERLTDRTRAIFINSPSNPTGNLLPPERMQRIADMARETKNIIFSDEIYHGLVYGNEGRAQERSILEFTDETFVLNGFSKLFAMTGLRLGYIIAPERFMRGIQKAQQNLFISANTVAQWAGVAALSGGCGVEVEAMRATYDERRVLLLKRLKEIGFGVSVEPTGAFYVFVNAKFLCQATGLDSYGLAFDILERACVGVTPGTDFGPGGEGYIRFSYANSLENIARAMDRLECYVKDRLAG